MRNIDFSDSRNQHGQSQQVSVPPKGRHGEIVAASQAYQTKAGVEIGIEPAKTNAAAATVVE